MPSENMTLQILAFDVPHPLTIFVNLTWGEYGYFLKLHIAVLLYFCVIMVGTREEESDTQESQT